MGSFTVFATLLLFLTTSPAVQAWSGSGYPKGAYGLESAHRRRAAADFAASRSIDVQAIDAAANASESAGKDVLDSFLARNDAPDTVDIYGDWLNFTGIAAYHFRGDMDVDCDGVDFTCSGNPDGQPQTSFGKLDATRVPFFVIPEDFTKVHTDIKPNALGAIICNGKMFYGIFGDENGDKPQVIGEASSLLATTCFPDEGLNGDKGHTPLDVLYIVFPADVPSGVGDEIIDLGALKQLGDQTVALLAKALGGAGRSPASSGTATDVPAATVATSEGSVPSASISGSSLATETDAPTGTKRPDDPDSSDHHEDQDDQDDQHDDDGDKDDDGGDQDDQDDDGQDDSDNQEDPDDQDDSDD